MHIDQLTKLLSLPEEGVHCLQMEVTRNFNTEYLEISHVIENQTGLTRLLEYYGPVPNVTAENPTRDGVPDYPILVTMRWLPNGPWELPDTWFITTFDVISNSAVRQILLRIREKLSRGDNPENKE